jgi:hypothetical protein
VAEHPNADVQAVMRDTGLTERKVQRTRAWKEHDEGRLERYLGDHPRAGTADVARAFGFSPAKAVRMRAWQAHQARRQAERARRPVRERPLAPATLACRADDGAADPAARISTREQLFRVLVERAEPEARARLHRLTSAQRESLLDHLLRSTDGAAPAGAGGEERLAIALAVVDSWLDEHEHEQEQRHAGRRGR